LQGNARWEYFVGKSLYTEGLNVPQYFGLATVSFSDASLPEFLTAASPEEDTWYLFMQHIHGVKCRELKDEERENAQKQHREQIKKAHNLGFETVDDYMDNNALFDRSQQKLYLIGFVEWKKRIRHRIRSLFF
jgi:hypothetical protein